MVSKTFYFQSFFYGGLHAIAVKNEMLLDPNKIVHVPWYISAFKRRRDVDGVSDGVILKTPSATSGM